MAAMNPYISQSGFADGLDRGSVLQDSSSTSLKLTLFKTISPFMLGASSTIIDGGALCMAQTMTAENFASVNEGMDMSIPLTMSP